MRIETVHCQSCGVGFSADQRRCPICRGQVRAPVAANDPLLPESEEDLEELESAPLGWARELSAKLKEAGIPNVLDLVERDVELSGRRTPGQAACRVLVPAARLEEAHAIAEAVFRRQVPAASGDWPGSPAASGSRPLVRTVSFAAATAIALVFAARCLAE
jgi:hypothetical protein